MTRLFSLLVALGLVASACGTPAPEVGSGDPQPNQTQSAPQPPDAATETNSGADGAAPSTAASIPADDGGTEASVEDDPPADGSGDDGSGDDESLVAEGPAVPDVTLALSDGTDLVVADASRPLMLVFWAEW